MFFSPQTGRKEGHISGKNYIVAINIVTTFPMAEKLQQKRKNRVSKAQITSDDEEKLEISDEDLEFLDEGVVKKVKKQTSRLRRVNEQTPCWKFFQIPQGDERVATCTKCSAVITCVDKRGKLTTTALNTHLSVCQTLFSDLETRFLHLLNLGKLLFKKLDLPLSQRTSPG